MRRRSIERKQSAAHMICCMGDDWQEKEAKEKEKNSS
jgi:hypothetical protein